MFRSVSGLLFSALALALVHSLAASPAVAQDRRIDESRDDAASSSSSSSGSGTSLEDEHAGRSRGGYAWGEEARDTGPQSTTAAHHYGAVFGSVGAGTTIRMIRYEVLTNTDQVAPAYLQLRGGYFFEGDGLFQHGAVLGIASNLGGEGYGAAGIDPFGQWALAPAYMVRLIPEGDIGNWLQATGRLGIPLAFATDGGGNTLFTWGWELGIGVLFHFLAGMGLYAEADLSMYFADDPANLHPLISFEGGLFIDYEVLP